MQVLQRVEEDQTKHTNHLLGQVDHECLSLRPACASCWRLPFYKYLYSQVGFVYVGGSCLRLRVSPLSFWWGSSPSTWVCPGVYTGATHHKAPFGIQFPPLNNDQGQSSSTRGYIYKTHAAAVLPLEGIETPKGENSQSWGQPIWRDMNISTCCLTCFCPGKHSSWQVVVEAHIRTPTLLTHQHLLWWTDRIFSLEFQNYSGDESWS